MTKKEFLQAVIAISAAANAQNQWADAGPNQQSHIVRDAIKLAKEIKKQTEDIE